MIAWIVYSIFLIIVLNGLLFSVALMFDIYTEEERENIHPMINKIYHLYFKR